MVNKRCRRKNPVFGPPTFTELFLSGNKFMVRWRIPFLPPSLGRWQFQGNYWKLLQSYSNAKHWQWAPFSKFFHFLLVLFASCLGMSSIVALVVITGIIKAAAYFQRQVGFSLQLWVGSLTIDTSVLTFNRTSHPSTSLHLDGIQSWCFPLLYFWGDFTCWPTQLVGSVGSCTRLAQTYGNLKTKTNILIFLITRAFAVLTPFDHFQNMSSGGIGPDLILTPLRSSTAWP